MKNKLNNREFTILEDDNLDDLEKLVELIYKEALKNL